MKTLIYLFIVCIFNNYNVNAQIDTNFCDINTLPADPSNLPVPTVVKTESYQAYVERNDAKRSVSEDVLEYFDGKKNVGIARTDTAQPPIRVYTYSDYKTNELISIINGVCGVTKLNETYQFLTPFYLVVVNGEEKIVSPLSILFLSDRIQFVYTGSSNFIRGIPVNEWQTCFYNKESVQHFTFSFSDPKKWTPVNTLGTQYDSVPVQVVIETKDTSGTIVTETYSITQYKPFLTLSEEDYYTPPGVYCPGRLSTYGIPQLPSAFQLTREVITGDVAVYNVFTKREQYDFDYELFRYSIDNTNINHIEDFKTGLYYTFNYLTNECQVTKLTANIQDENIFFNFRDINYQYTGQRTIDGVHTDVFIGQTKFLNQNATFEWCFLADGWTREDQVGDNAAVTPVLLTVYFISSGKPKPAFYNHFYNYHTTNEILLNHDLSNCNNSETRKRFVFSLSAELAQVVNNYITLFEVAAVSKLQKIAKVNVLRISKIRVAVDNDGVFFLFTLHDKSKFYGDNATIEEDVSLDEAVNNLKKAFNRKFKISFLISEGREISLDINENSLVEISDESDGYIRIEKQIYEQGYTKSSVAAVTIMAVTIGITFSFLLVVLHKVSVIKLPLIV